MLLVGLATHEAAPDVVEEARFRRRHALLAILATGKTIRQGSAVKLRPPASACRLAAVGPLWWPAPSARPAVATR